MKLDYNKLHEKFTKSGENLTTFCKQRDLTYASVHRAFKREGLSTKNETRVSSESPDLSETKRSGCLPSTSEIEDSSFAKPNSRVKQRKRSGNRNPSNLFKKGNQSARKHGGYAKFIEDEDLIAAEATTLEDELVLFRSRMQSCLKVLDEVTQRISKGEAQDLDSDLALISSSENAIDRISSRIESLERTITSMGLTNVTKELKEAEIQHKVAITEKVKLESERLRNLDNEGGNTDFAVMMKDIRAMEQGLLSVSSENKTEG